MNNDRIKKYDELDVDEKEVLDSFRKMKLMYDYARFRLHKLQVEDLINDYEELKKLRKEIQVKYFSIYEELLAEDLIEGDWMLVFGELLGTMKMKHGMLS